MYDDDEDERDSTGTPKENQWGLAALLARAVMKAEKFAPDLADRIQEIAAEVAERAGPESLSPRFSFRESGEIMADHQGSAMIAVALARTAQHAQNYVSVEVIDPELGALVLIVQRKGRLTPHNARVAAEAMARDLAGRLAKHGEEIEIPISFIPDVVPFEHVKHEDPTPWLVFEHKRDPARFKCVCGGTQELPRKMTIETYEAMAGVFKGTHADCKRLMPATPADKNEGT